jgi:hypothetical protein
MPMTDVQQVCRNSVANKEINLRHVVDADMPVDFLIKIYHLKN